MAAPISLDRIAQIFREVAPALPIPKSSDVAQIAEYIAMNPVTQNRHAPSRPAAVERVASAARAILRDVSNTRDALRGTISSSSKEAEPALADLIRKSIEALDGLQEHATSACALFAKAGVKPPKITPWHKAAEQIAELVQQSFRQAGCSAWGEDGRPTVPAFKNVASPVVQIVHRLLREGLQIKSATIGAVAKVLAASARLNYLDNLSTAWMDEARLAKHRSRSVIRKQ